MSRRWVEMCMNGARRAQRFAIAMPIQYQALDDLVWMYGGVENISRTGVLLRGPELVSSNAPVEVRFALPAEVRGEDSAVVICHGEVVHVLQPPASDAPKRLAVRILNYCFERGAGGQLCRQSMTGVFRQPSPRPFKGEGAPQSATREAMRR
jgi:hypothetical protein